MQTVSSHPFKRASSFVFPSNIVNFTAITWQTQHGKLFWETHQLATSLVDDSTSVWWKTEKDSCKLGPIHRPLSLGLLSLSVLQDFCDTPEQFPDQIHTIGRTRGHRVLLITRDMTVMKVPMRHRGHVFQFLWTRASSKPLEKIWPRLSGDIDYGKIKEGTTNVRHSLVRTNTRHRANSSLFFVVSSVDLNLTSLGYNIRTRKVLHQSWNYGHQKWLLDANVFWISDRKNMLMTVTEVSPYNYKYNWVWIDQLSSKGGYLMRNNSPLSQLCFDAIKSRIIFSYYACTSVWPEALKRGFISGKWVYLLGEKTVFIFRKKHMPRNQYFIQRSVYAYRVDYQNFLNCTITRTSTNGAFN